MDQTKRAKFELRADGIASLKVKLNEGCRNGRSCLAEGGTRIATAHAILPIQTSLPSNASSMFADRELTSTSSFRFSSSMKGYSQKNYHIGDGTLYSVMIPHQTKQVARTYRGSTPGRGRGR